MKTRNCLDHFDKKSSENVNRYRIDPRDSNRTLAITSKTASFLASFRCVDLDDATGSGTAPRACSTSRAAPGCHRLISVPLPRPALRQAVINSLPGLRGSARPALSADQVYVESFIASQRLASDRRGSQRPGWRGPKWRPSPLPPQPPRTPLLHLCLVIQNGWMCNS